MRILIIKMSSLGDLFHALPLAHAVKAHYHATLDWVVQPAYADLAKCFTDVERVIVFPRHGFFRGAPAFTRELRRYAYDLILDLQGLLKSALVTRLARGRRRIGPSYARENAGFAYNEVAGRRNKQRHAIEEILDFLDHLNIPRGDPVFPLSFPEVEVTGQAPHVALAPCSRWATKNWPVEHFIILADRLVRECGVTVCLVGAPDDREVCDRIATSNPAIQNWCGKTTLIQLGGLLSKMDLMITVDSGPMHIAAACGIPCLALFGATAPERTGPFGHIHQIITVPDLDCRPCLSRSCQRGDLACLAEIDPALVFTLARKMLDNASGDGAGTHER